MRILLVEDEKLLRDVIKKRLIKEHYSIDTVGDGLEALEYIRQADYDAAILDIMLPGISGLELLRTIRREGSTVPVLFLTAKDSIADRVIGLDAGAEDYLVKPFAFEELLARLRVLLRKQAPFDAAENKLTVHDLVMDVKSHRVWRNQEIVELSSKEFQLLEYMMRNKGIVLTREAIEAHVWDYSYMGGSNMVDVYIRYLRRKIDEKQDIKLIHTIRGKGYVLRADL